MMSVKVGDYVRALLVTHVPLLEVDADLTREGLVVGIRDGGTELVLATCQGNELICFAQGAVGLDQSTLDNETKRFIAFVSRHLDRTSG